MAQIYKLKVADHLVGTHIPFPLLYLAPESLIPSVQRAFKIFMGFPARDHEDIGWHKLYIKSTIKGVTHKHATPCNQPLNEIITDLMREEDPWHAIVPILALSLPVPPRPPRDKPKGDPRKLYNGRSPYFSRDVQGDDEGRPALAFIQDARWTHQQDTPAYPLGAYFVTPDEVFPSLCSACPRYAHHQAGLCNIGDPVCFKTLRDFAVDTLPDKLRAYNNHLIGNMGDSYDDVPTD